MRAFRLVAAVAIVAAAGVVALAADRAAGNDGGVSATAITFGALDQRGWIELPEVAGTAARAIAADDVGRHMAVRAWGDPALGCFAIGVAVRLPGASGSPGDLARALAGAFGSELADPTIQEGPDRISGEHRVRRGALRGWLLFRARAQDGVNAEAATCLHNQRAPERCAALCARARKRFESQP